jgi:hypothetical protein
VSGSPDDDAPPAPVRVPLPRPIKGALVLALVYWVPLLIAVGLVRLIVPFAGTGEGPFYGVVMTLAILTIYVMPILGTIGGVIGALLGGAGLITAVREEQFRVLAAVVTGLCVLAFVLGIVQFSAGSGWMLRTH